jgi:hypothetical protein
MSKRVTIMVPDELFMKLRRVQSKVIAETSKPYSFSKTICDNVKVPTRSKKQ